MQKKYKLGFFIGRLQHIHNFHEYIINIGIENCEKFIVIIGSAQEKNTLRNPFSIETRIDLVRQIFSDKVDIIALNDLSNEKDVTYDWGKYLLKAIKNESNGLLPDFMIYGNEESRQGWFDPTDISDIYSYIIERNPNTISSTKIREMIKNNKKEVWMKHTNPNIHNKFEKLKEELLFIEN